MQHGLEVVQPAAEARPLLSRLIMGEGSELSSEEQKLISFWSYKAALLFQLLRAPSAQAIPRFRFHELFRLRRAPAEARLWLAASNNPTPMHETSTEVDMVNVQHRVPGFFSAVFIGDLVILCAGRISPGPEQVSAGSLGRSSSVIRIWPASLRPVNWPPAEPIEDLEAKELVKLV